MAAERRRFQFVQWEFPGRLGPEPGRYVVRRFAGDDARQVVVIAGIEAPRRRRMSSRRAARAEPGAGPPPPVEVTRATVISTDPLPDDDAGAKAWLAAAAGERALQTIADALRLLNLTVHGHRLAAADPYVAEVCTGQAIAVRIGYGSGEQVADGRWEAASELPPGDQRPRRLALSPQERLGALLGGRDVALACEELALRARLDLDQGREREAALQARVALEAAIAELEGWRASGPIADRIDELRGHVEPLEAAAGAALRGGLQPAELAVVEVALGRLEAALRARSAAS
jgi:hypothetical protein